MAAWANAGHDKWWCKTPLSKSERQLVKELHAAMDATRSVQDIGAEDPDLTPLHYAVLLGRPDLL